MYSNERHRMQSDIIDRAWTLTITGFLIGSPWSEENIKKHIENQNKQQ